MLNITDSTVQFVSFFLINSLLQFLFIWLFFNVPITNVSREANGFSVTFFHNTKGDGGSMK